MEKVSTGFGLRQVLWKKWSIILVTGLLLLGWLFNTPAGLLGKADAIGYAVCHRIDVRSFHLGDRQVPLCARCTGMYLGAVLGLIYQAILGRRRSGLPPWPLWIVLGGFAAAFGVDGLNSYVNLMQQVLPLRIHSVYEPQNWLRLLTGTGMGVAISAGLMPAFNQTVWKLFDPRPILVNFRTLGGLVALALVMDLLVLSENPLILYPLALVSAAGVPILLTMIYTMIWLLILRKDNQIEHASQLWLLLLGGFAIALIQIGLFDLARFQLTHTWGEFPLGL